MVDNIYFEYVDELIPVLSEEIQEIIEAVWEYKECHLENKEHELKQIYNEIQDASIVLLSMDGHYAVKHSIGKN